MAWLQFNGLGFLGQSAAEQKAWSTADGQALAVYALPDHLEKRFKPFYQAAVRAWKALPQNPASALTVTAHINKSLRRLGSGADFSFELIEDEYERAEDKDDFELQMLLIDLDRGLGTMVSLIEVSAVRPAPAPGKPAPISEKKTTPVNGARAVLSAAEISRLAAQRRGVVLGAPKGALTERQQFELMMAARKRSEPGAGTAVGVAFLGLSVLGLIWAFRRRR